MRKQLLFLSLCCLSILLMGQTTLSTYPALTANNGSGGVSFTATSNVDIEVQAFENTLYAGPMNVQIWYRPGGVLHPGGTSPSVSTTNGWILHETVSATGNGTSPTLLPLTTPLPMDAGVTYGFALGNSSTTSRYVSYTASLTTTFTDGTLTINAGVGSGFGGTIPNLTIATRCFSGSMIYDVVSTSPNDAGIASIDKPKVSCEGEYDVEVTVRNYGKNQISTVTVNWEVDGNPMNPFVLTQLLDTNKGVGSKTASVMLGSVNLVGGVPSTIKVWTTDPNSASDTVNKNDTITKVYNNILPTVGTFPYIQDFEAGQADWAIGGSVTTWAFGTPAKPIINGAASGVNCFVTGGLSGQYVASENSQVSSPCFDLTNFEGEAWVALDVWWNAEFSWDGAVLQYSLDGGTAWKNIGKMGDPFNWYNDNSINGNPGGQQEGWSGRNSSSNGSGGWVRAKHAVPSEVIGEPGVRFRIGFGADGSIQDEGFAFDNFILVDYRKANLGPDVISLCGEPNLILDPKVTDPSTYVWSTGDTVSSTITVNTTGDFSVLVTDSILDLTSGDTVNIIDTDPPQINFTKTIDTAFVTSHVTLDPNLAYSNSFMWTPGGFQYPYLLVRGSDYGLGAHTFNLLVTDSVDCKDEASAVVVFIEDYTGIGDVQKGQLTFFPNPAKERLTVKLDGVNADHISIFSLTGQQVFGKPVQNQQLVNINLGSFESGMYMLVVKIGEEQVVHRFVKE